MPVRLLRPGLTTSQKWNALDWRTQSFYVRLLTLVDDYGRYEADERLLKSHAFPLSDDVTCKQVLAMCEQLQATALAVFYQTDTGKKCLQLLNWYEKPRSEPKFPAFESTCKQMFTDENRCSAPTPSPSPSPSSLDASASRNGAGDSEDFRAFWEAYPKKVAKAEARKAFEKVAKRVPLASLVEAIRRLAESPDWKKEGGQFIPYPSTWLNREGWEDQIQADPNTIEKRRATSYY